MLLLVSAVGLSGCVTPFRPPADVAHIKLERSDSGTVVVSKIWLERKKGPLVVTGYVLKRLKAEDTTGTHLDVTLFGADGEVLRTSVEHFEPRQIPLRYRVPDSASYRIPLDPLPAGTARILVGAHDAPEHRQ